MWRTLHRFVSLITLCSGVLLCSASNSTQCPPQKLASSTTGNPSYFPADAPGGFFAAFFSDYLSRVGEPSLLAAAQEPNVTCYRFESLGAQTGRVIAVRLSLNPDGTARIFTAEESGPPRVLHVKESSLIATDSSKFLQLVEKAGFWSMPAHEPENPDPRRRVYKMDASTWVFEGVRGGRYHVVLRQGPDPSPFTDMVHFLLRDLAKVR